MTTPQRSQMIGLTCATSACGAVAVGGASAGAAVFARPSFGFAFSTTRVTILTGGARRPEHRPHIVCQDGAFPAFVVTPQDDFYLFGEPLRVELLLLQVCLKCIREVHRLPLPRTVRLPAGRPSILRGSVAPGISVPTILLARPWLYSNSRRLQPRRQPGAIP